VNREWHKEHRMPERATETERIGWHLEHIRNCVCRPFPKGLMDKLSDEQRRQATSDTEARPMPRS